MNEKDETRVSALDLLRMLPNDALVPIRVEIGMDAVYIFTTADTGTQEEANALKVMQALCEDLCNKKIPHEPRERKVEKRSMVDCIMIKYEDVVKAKNKEETKQAAA